MPIEPQLLSPGLELLTAILALPVLGHALATAPWQSWLDRSDRQHLWLGSLVLLLLVWSMRAGITPGLSFQFLMVAALTLMHGWRLAAIGVAVVLAVECLRHGGWSAWPANVLCYGLVPAGFVAWLHGAVQRRLPQHFFVYFFVTVFAGSMLAFNLAGLARFGLLAASDSLAWERVAGEYLAYLPVMSFAEATLNGIVMAMAVVYRPDWVVSFDDRVYLRSR